MYYAPRWHMKLLSNSGMAEGEWRERARERWREVGGGRWWIFYACVCVCVYVLTACACAPVCMHSPALTRGGRWLTSLYFEKSKHCECVWMGAQQDLKDSNEVIGGCVTHTHTRMFEYAHVHSLLHTPVWICDMLKVWEKSLRWDNKKKAGIKMSSK